jgi:hypothetical protein
MLAAHNLAQIQQEREVNKNVTDFGSTFKKHEETHQKLYFLQVNHAASE